MEGKIEGIVGVDGLAGQQKDIAVEGEPAEGEEDYYNHQHLHGSLLLASQGKVLLGSHITNGVAQPQLLGHTGIGH